MIRWNTHPTATPLDLRTTMEMEKFKDDFEKLYLQALKNLEDAKEGATYVTGDPEEALRMEGEVRFAEMVSELIAAYGD